MTRSLEILDFGRGPRGLAYTAAIAGRAFTCRVRYDSVDLLELERRHGAEALRRIYLHAVAFDLNRLVSLAPDTVDFGPLSDLVTSELWELWTAIYRGVWAQWRYENGRPDYQGPRLARRPSTCPAPRPRFDPVAATSGAGRTLLLCGGGKDSLLAAKLFEEIGEPYEALGYSHSGYGPAAAQHELIDGLLDHCAPRRRHRLWIEDELTKMELDLETLGVRTLTAAETPSALFLALPVALAHGLDRLVVAHERSANLPNLVWERTGEAVNHQWGKSLEAESLLDDYVGAHLLPGVRYFSVLQPLRDPPIFAALAEHPAAIPATHSCNVSKPWCGRCPKCLYVFLGYAACLPRPLVERTFGGNLLDVEENLAGFARLLGFEDHLPFECVGQPEESRWALARAAHRGWTGAVIERFAERCGTEIPPDLLAVAATRHRIPEPLAERILPILHRWAAKGGQVTYL